ncbi:hypothetical protein EV646_104317 [Kribbella antiqua]|uniref:Uncharacterized protein n=1 Tax=Kribbella antiqua TaxID=2512217 RepID=A0A4R2IZU0_9ACTN|nr:hypothetical protein [Kribbella antiqua]TCO48495.1 hypothetical protein EV646_104317 [Kribbella antiqua]
MYDGAVILESLRVGTELGEIPLVVRKLSRYAMSTASADQPKVWSVLEFGVDDSRAEDLAKTLSEALDAPGWYADFHNDDEIFVVFPGRVFRYARGDSGARAEAQEFGRTLKIPEPQLDWTF